MKKVTLLTAGLIWILASCNDSKKESDKPESESSVMLGTDPVVYSFAFMGCNRVDRGDSSNASTANVLALQSILNDMLTLKNKPSFFFFMGDLVLAEKKTTTDLDQQLNAWLNQYEDTSFSLFSGSGSKIEMIAMPGNHEMLYKKKRDGYAEDEWPLDGATNTWLKYMAGFMPANRTKVTGTDSINNQMTFAFTRNDIGFVVMNTDTYNSPTDSNKYGIEGMIPTQWVIDQVNALKANAAIKHIFVLGHKPYYVNGDSSTAHNGLPAGPVIWPAFNKAGVVAMLSAHEHDYQRWQLPADTGTYQIIAGNGGSQGKAAFYGYTMINILKSGKVQLVSRGFTKQDPYYRLPEPVNFTTRDSTILTWTKNANPYKN
jgi:hypothetical protein